MEPVQTVVLVRGSGDVGSAVAHLLFCSGFFVVIHDIALPAAHRRGMAFCDAIFDGSCVLAGIDAGRVDDVGKLAAQLVARAAIPVTTAELTTVLGAVAPAVLVDARMRKRTQPEDQRDLAPLTIGLGPNFVAGRTTHLSIETQWGDELGAVVREGVTKRLGGEPRSIAGHARDRFVYAPASGVLRTDAAIAQPVRAGEIVATIGDQQLAAPLDGILRGLTHDGVPVEAGTKVLEVDPRGDVSAVIGIGKRPRRIAAGVLRAIQTAGVSRSRRSDDGA